MNLYEIGGGYMLGINEQGNELSGFINYLEILE
jgi:hypothetical protein